MKYKVLKKSFIVKTGKLHYFVVPVKEESAGTASHIRRPDAEKEAE